MSRDADLPDGADDAPKKIALDLDWFPEPLSSPHAVIFLPSGRRTTIDHGYSVFEAAHAAGVYVPTTCGGKGTCGCCRVHLEGDPSAPTYADKHFLTLPEIRAGIRLACRLRVDRDMEITVLPG